MTTVHHTLPPRSLMPRLLISDLQALSQVIQGLALLLRPEKRIRAQARMKRKTPLVTETTA